MAYTTDKLHPLDPGTGQLDRPEGQTLEEAEIIVLEHRMRHRARAELKAQYRDDLPDLPDCSPEGRYFGTNLIVQFPSALT
jgi:hypothetical protein